MLKLTLIGTLVYFCFNSMLAQGYDYIQYTTKDGLPTNYVYGVIEDDEGYIWAYTENGMSKFDGHTFQNFSTKDGLPGNDIVYAMKDDVGRIWLQTYKNKPAYILNDSVHIVYDQSCVPTHLEKGNVVCSCEDYKNFIYEDGQTKWQSAIHLDSLILSYENEVLQLDSIRLISKEQKDYTLMREKNSFYNLNKDSVYYFSDNRAYILFYRSFKDGFIFYSNHSGMAYWKRGNQRKSIFVGKLEGKIIEYFSGKDTEKYILKSDGNKFIQIDISEGKAQIIKFSKKKPRKYNSLSPRYLDDRFLVENSFGFLEYDLDGNVLDSLDFKELNENYFLHRFYKDSRGNIWIGSREGGLFLIPEKRRKTKIISSSKSNDKTFEQLIQTQDDKLLGITDNSGIYHIKEDSLILIVPPDKRVRFLSATLTPYGVLVSSSTQSYLITNIGDQFFIKNFSDQFKLKNVNGIIRLSGRANNLEAFANVLNGRALIYHEKEQCLYVVQVGKIIQYRFLNDNEYEITIIPFQSTALHLHQNLDQIFCGRRNGVFRLVDNTLIPFLASHKELTNVSTLFGTRDKLWIGTESNGLFVYNFSKEILSKIDPTSTIRNIKLDTDSTLLVASNEGVLVVNKNKPLQTPIVYYTMNDGLSSNEIQDIHFDGNQYIYVATSENLHKIDRNKNYESNISDTDLFIKNIEVNKKPLDWNEKISLSHLENTIDINYQLMSYASNGKIVYETKLEPLEKDWRKNTTQTVNYLSLPPNKYTFHLKGKDVYGNEVSLNPVSITIKKAFWQTNWFKLLLALITLALIVAIIKYRDRKNRIQLDKEKEINRRMASLELSALKAQMNPHFVFNALGAIQYFIQINDVEAADNYLTRFARLMRKYLDSSKERMLSLKEEFELLTIYTDLEKLRFEDLFSVEISVADNIRQEDVFLPSMIIQPFVENAINHGLNERRDKKGILKIRFVKKYEALLCIISDNGIGRNNANGKQWKGHKSRGIEIINDKVETLKSSGIADVSITINDLNPNEKTFPGTEVQLRIKNLEDEKL